MYMSGMGTNGVSVASPGFGSAANSFMDFVNVDEKLPFYRIPQNLHRRKDPGAGAMTYHHSRYSNAEADIRAGEELFVNYGSPWFLERIYSLGPIPVKGDYGIAEKLYRTLQKIMVDQEERQGEATNSNDSNEQDDDDKERIPPPRPSPRLIEAADMLWEDFMTKSSWDNSPTMAAMPPKELHDEIFQDGSTLFEWKKSQMTRSMEWLEENGICCDHFHAGESTLPQAGNGAFASRVLRKGEHVLPIPLIHLPDRSVLDMKGRMDNSENTDQPRRRQLLLNYALGHRDSTLLLSPYGPAFGLINHNQTLANVRLVWASPQRSQHKPEMLNKSVSAFEGLPSAQLGMELVATRDIAIGDEIFLDYGDEWETAWQEHVERWKPEPDADRYQSAYEMNLDFDHVFRTEFEQLYDPYPPTVMTKFHKYFKDPDTTRKWLGLHPFQQDDIVSWRANGSVKCNILRRQDSGSRMLYTIAIPVDDSSDWTIVEGIPMEAMFFEDQPYSTDMFLQNAFRHDIRIPDDMFPESWKNLKRNRNLDGISSGDESP